MGTAAEARLPLLSRACHDRSVVNGGTLFTTIAAFPEQHRFTLDLPARPGKRQHRKARLSVRFGKVRICRPKSCSDPKAPAEIELSAIEVSEIAPPPGEDPITWRLLSTHDVETVEQALRLIGWYRQRWHIEQLFRTVKRQGLDIEGSSIVEGDVLEKLAVIALIAACQTMQLVLAFASPHDTQPASHVFNNREIQVLEALQGRLQGRTEKQRNPYRYGLSAGQRGPSPASADGPATKVTNRPDQSPCVTDSNDLEQLCKVTSSMKKICAQARFYGEVSDFTTGSRAPTWMVTESTGGKIRSSRR
jgi:hypothetical protein